MGDKNDSTIRLYTDGACSGNPGPGGWAAILIWRDRERTIAGCEPETTNNRMELKAVIEGLHAIRDPKIPVEVWTDSTYVQKGMSEWLPQWQNRNWKKVKNVDLWLELVQLRNRFPRITFHHVRGHSGHAYNERCDKEARKQIENCR